MTDQPALFAVEECTAGRAARPKPEVDEDGLRAIAFLYTVTATPTATGIRFAATVEDAQRWCDSPLSRSALHGTAWIYCWTSAWNFVRNHTGDADAYGGYAYQLDLRGLRDNGTWDDRITSTGCQIIRLEELPALLEPMGVRVLADPAIEYRAARRAAA